MEDKKYYINKAKQVLLEVKKNVIGKDEVLCKIMMAILAKGHVLIEDIPGVGKTTMATSFAQVLNLKYNRIQFTPDVMPSDIVGFNMYNKATNGFEYRDGAAMCNILLADEINRTSPKTQSALLQVMEEGAVTIDGSVKKLPDPFIVLATQNHLGSAGTQRLPESQLDRFMIKISMGYPAINDEINIMKSKQTVQEQLSKVVTHEDFLGMREAANKVYVHDAVYDYVARIADTTRNSKEILQGMSPRASIAVIAMSKAEAFLRGREYVVPSDVQYILADVIGHRIVINKGIRRTNITEQSVIKSVLENVSVPTITMSEKSDSIIW